jgi:hypothetical protein
MGDLSVRQRDPLDRFLSLMEGVLRRGFRGGVLERGREAFRKNLLNERFEDSRW